MKKNYFSLLCSVLLSICLLGTACSDDGDTTTPDNTPQTPETPAVVEPSFPEPVVKTATAGEEIELTFDANYDWKATISEESYTYFQLLDGENTAKTITGTKGDDITITVKVADVTIYDDAPSTEVTLTMNNKSKVIATITYPITDRTFEVYAPEYNEYGVFEGEYAEEAIAEDDVLEMVYGAPDKGEESTFFVPAKLVANFPFIIAGPEWMVAMEAGAAGDNEVIIMADPTKIPAAATEATIDILVDSDSEEPFTSFKVSLAGADSYIAIDNLNEDGEVEELLVEYTFDAKLTANSEKLSSRTITASKDVVIKAIDEDGKAIDWFTVAADEWDAEGSTIQTRMLSISNVKANDAETSRVAYIYAVPKAKAADFDIKKAAEFYVATVEQHAAPATITYDEDTFDGSTTKFGVAADDINYWFTVGALSEIYIGNRYDISYYGEWADYGYENYFIASRAIASFEYYAYNEMGNFAKIAEDNSWVTANAFGEGEEMFKFNIFVDESTASFDESLNFNTGEAEAVILVKYTDGTYSGIYFHYKKDTEAAEATATITYQNWNEEIAFQSVEGNGWPYVSLPEADEYYSLTFGGWQFEDTSFVTGNKTIGAVTTYTIWGGDMAERENTWFTPQVFGANNNMFKIDIPYDGTYATHDDAYNAWNSETGMLDAALCVYFTDGTTAVIYMQYNEAGAVTGDAPLLSFAYPDWVGSMDGSTLTEVTSGDLYEQFVGELGAAAVWELTYYTPSPTISMVKGFDPSWTIHLKPEWIEYEYSEGGSVVKMNTEESNMGYIVFSDGSGCPLVLICTYVAPEF